MPVDSWVLCSALLARWQQTPSASSCCHCRSLSLRKIKSSNSKLSFGTLLNDPTHPDWRFKLLAQYNFKAVSLCHHCLTATATVA
jgi:hypothetical protein